VRGDGILSCTNRLTMLWDATNSGCLAGRWTVRCYLSGRVKQDSLMVVQHSIVSEPWFDSGVETKKRERLGLQGQYRRE
jgi:hypothetical protein